MGKKLNEYGLVFWDSKLAKINDRIPSGFIKCPECGDDITWTYVPVIDEDNSYTVTLENFQCLGRRNSGMPHYFNKENLPKDIQTYLDKTYIEDFQMFLKQTTNAIKIKKKGSEVSVAKIGGLKRSVEKTEYKCGICNKKHFIDWIIDRNLHICRNCGWINKFK